MLAPSMLLAIGSVRATIWAYGRATSRIGSPSCTRAAKIGVVMVTMNPVFKSNELDYVLKQSDMKALCVIDAYRDVDYLQIIRDLVPESLNVQRGFLHSEAYPFLENLIYMGPEKHRGFYSVPELLLLLGQHKPDRTRMGPQFDNNDVVMMQYTSGTTGFPQGRHAHASQHHLNNGFYIGEGQSSVPKTACVCPCRTSTASVACWGHGLPHPPLHHAHR